MTRAFLSCDWGTSRLRLRRVELDPFRVTGEVIADEGVSMVRERIAREGTEPAHAFSAVLERTRNDLASRSPAQERLPIIVSGMASSSIGWLELPYAEVPFPLDGSGARWQEVDREGAPARGRVFLLSGLRTDLDVLRGEETEALGLFGLPSYRDLRRTALAVLPGTHSKHLRVEDGCITSFRTYMTGELFAVLSSASILRHSVAPLAAAASPALDDGDFRDGVLRARERSLPAALFSVRANQLLRGLDPARNAAYLSGILVGSEALDAARGLEPGEQIILCAGPGLNEAYRAAFGALGYFDRVISVPAELAGSVAARGQAQLLERMLGEAPP